MTDIVTPPDWAAPNGTLYPGVDIDWSSIVQYNNGYFAVVPRDGSRRALFLLWTRNHIIRGC